jgi:hypothetical protein
LRNRIDRGHDRYNAHRQYNRNWRAGRVQRYFLHCFDTASPVFDDIGEVLDDEVAARQRAIWCARDILANSMLAGSAIDPNGYLSVQDIFGHEYFRVRYTDVICLYNEPTCDDKYSTSDILSFFPACEDPQAYEYAEVKIDYTFWIKTLASLFAIIFLCIALYWIFHAVRDFVFRLNRSDEVAAGPLGGFLLNQRTSMPARANCNLHIPLPAMLRLALGRRVVAIDRAEVAVAAGENSASPSNQGIWLAPGKRGYQGLSPTGLENPPSPVPHAGDELALAAPDPAPGNPRHRSPDLPASVSTYENQQVPIRLTAL